MDPIVQRELFKLDPQVPFRAKHPYVHRTWARTYHSRAELFIQPESTEEIQKVVTLARRCRRRLVTVGCGHSPSDLTCTSSWMVNLDNYKNILSVDLRTKIVVMQAGIRLRQLNIELKENGLAMPILGSIDEQSIAGAICTGTHGSSIKHGPISESVLGLKLLLSNGRTVSCSAEQNTELFRAALLSLGALGIIVEVTIKTVPAFNISWHQKVFTLDDILKDWRNGLWTEAEFTRVWWFPHTKRCAKWTADKTHEPVRVPKGSWLGGKIGYHIYHTLLYVAQWIPSILPAIERFAVAVQYGGSEMSGVEESRKGLLMNCLYSQFVNEWAIPLDKGPEAMQRLSDWLNGNVKASRIPFSAEGLYVHSPIEVRVVNTLSKGPRPYLDNTMPDGPSLLLNATLYRPYNSDPPCHLRYYQAFQWLMKEMGGRPHWAKNFAQITSAEFHAMYLDVPAWLRVREDLDPEGMFLGDWHRRHLMPTKESSSTLPLEERRISTEPLPGGGVMWQGEILGKPSSPHNSEESFDLMHGAEAERSVVLDDGNGGE